MPFKDAESPPPAHVYPPSDAMAALRSVQRKDDHDLEAMLPARRRQRPFTFGNGELVMIVCSIAAVVGLTLVAAALTTLKTSW